MENKQKKVLKACCCSHSREDGSFSSGSFNETGCIAACPQCLRTCTLDQGHYSSHHCSEGHSWL